MNRNLCGNLPSRAGRDGQTKYNKENGSTHGDDPLLFETTYRLIAVRLNCFVVYASYFSSVWDIVVLEIGLSETVCETAV